MAEDNILQIWQMAENIYMDDAEKDDGKAWTLSSKPQTLNPKP